MAFNNTLNALLNDALELLGNKQEIQGNHETSKVRKA